ncbi:MAG TPA: hypothetical protein VD908_12315 [Cytophagales bacterium]|nr:hypothetical protein [Cytophagales bacterium]
MRFCLCFLFIFINTISFSQVFPSEIWYEGKVYLDSQETLRGHIKYDFDNDLIQVNSDNLIKTFSTRKFTSFEITDTDRNVVRSFYSLPYYRVSNYKVPMMFELVKEGKNLSLLSREYITTETVPQYDFYTHRNYYFNRSVVAYNYYLLFPTGKIRQYHFNKNELLDLLKDKSSEIKKYVKENRLKYDKREDLIEIVTYYNTLKK